MWLQIELLLPWSAWGLKTASNLKVFLGTPFEITVSSLSLADSKSIAIEAPNESSSAFNGLHRQNTLMFPASKHQFSIKPLWLPIWTNLGYQKASIQLPFNSKTLLYSSFCSLAPSTNLILRSSCKSICSFTIRTWTFKLRTKRGKKSLIIVLQKNC